MNRTSFAIGGVLGLALDAGILWWLTRDPNHSKENSHA